MTYSLKSKAQKGFKWTVIKTLFNSIIQPIYRILLALLLVPSEYAIIAIITLIVSFAEMLNNIGVGEAVIQRDNITQKELSSLYFLNLFISILLAFLLYISSNLIAEYYSLIELDKIIKVLTFVILINGSTSLFKFYLHKGFFFRETTLAQIIKIIIEIIIAVVLIKLGYGIWGYVVSILLSNAVHGTLLFIDVFRKTNFRISCYFSIKSLMRFLNFGIFVGAKKILTFTSHRIDEVIIGGALLPEVLGAYFLAKNILFQLQTLITTSFGQVLLPLFSKIKENISLLKKYYINILSTVSIISFPLFIGIIITAQYFVPIIFGEEWLLSIKVFQFLAIPIIVEVLSAGITSSLLYSQNKTFLVFMIDLIFSISYALLLAFFNDGRLFNIVFIYSSYIVFKFIISQYYLSKILRLTFRDYIKIFKESFITTTGMTIILIILKFIIDNQLPQIIILIILIVIGAISYIILNLVLNKQKALGVFRLLLNILKR